MDVWAHVHERRGQALLQPHPEVEPAAGPLETQPAAAVLLDGCGDGLHLALVLLLDVSDLPVPLAGA